MQVLMKIGLYAGQVRDVRAINARGLIERGEATDPNQPIVSEVDPATPVAEVDPSIVAKAARVGRQR
jgi:hypothetical protein